MPGSHSRSRSPDDRQSRRKFSRSRSPRPSHEGRYGDGGGRRSERRDDRRDDRRHDRRHDRSRDGDDRYGGRDSHYDDRRGEYRSRRNSYGDRRDGGRDFRDRRPARKPFLGNQQDRETSRCLFVGNLSYRVADRDLAELFEKCGPLEKATVGMNKRTGESKGFGFVTFEDRKDAEDAYSRFQEYDLEGRRLRLDWDVGLDKKPSGNRPGEGEDSGRGGYNRRDHGGYRERSRTPPRYAASP